MARVKRAVNAHKKRRETLERASGYRGQRSRLYRKAKEQVTHSLGLRLPRPPGAQGRLPPALDPAHQRRGPRQRHDVQPVHPGPQGRRRRGRPPHARRAGRQRRRRVRRAGRGRRRACRRSPAHRGLSRPRPQRPHDPRCRERPERRGVLSNPRSDRVRAVRRLAGRSARERAGRFLVEGPQAVREAVAARPQRGTVRCVRELYLTRGRPRRATRSSSPRPARRRRGPRRSPTRCSRAMARQHRHARRAWSRSAPCSTCRSATSLARAGRRLVAVLAQVRDPGNAGTVIRAADAAGADAVVLTDAQRRRPQPQVRARHRRAACSTCRSSPASRSPSAVAEPARRRASRCSRPTAPATSTSTTCWTRPSRARRAARRPGRVDLRQRGVGPAGRRTGRWPTRVVRVPIHGRAESPQPRHRRHRLPLRLGPRPAPRPAHRPSTRSDAGPSAVVRRSRRRVHRSACDGAGDPGRAGSEVREDREPCPDPTRTSTPSRCPR